MDPGILDREQQVTNSLETNAKMIPRSDVWMFIAQIFICVIVICVSLVNLTLQIGNQQLFTVLLTATVGYVLPNPRLKFVPLTGEKPLAT